MPCPVSAVKAMSLLSVGSVGSLFTKSAIKGVFVSVAKFLP